MLPMYDDDLADVGRIVNHNDDPAIEYLTNVGATLLRSVAYWKAEAEKARRAHGRAVAQAGHENGVLHRALVLARGNLSIIAKGRGKYASTARDALESIADIIGMEMSSD
jgi:hypothetical protein